MVYRILSIDGGGVRGLVAAIWLTRLEALLQSSLREHFDLIAGTSTGSIIACGLSMGMSAEAIVNFYLTQSREVFPGTPGRLWNRIGRTLTQGLDAPRYDGKGLERVLRRVFGTIPFGDLPRRTLVTSYDALNREALVLKNDRPVYNRIPIWEVCKASASAPVYFPAHLLNLDGQTIPVIDGGVVANNPTACAIAEAVRVNQGRAIDQQIGIDNFLVASFGTGETIRPITARQSQDWGALEWAIPLIDVLFDGSADATDYIAQYLLAAGNYFRFQTPLDTAYDDLDNADATNLNALVGVAETYLRQTGEARLNELAERLRSTAK
ncbi:MAG: patatin [Microcoleus sp. SIO2G3]|nr:patatin [Microcoleus sp. SIO2G3]